MNYEGTPADLNNKLFVYGTLQRGGPLSHMLLEGAYRGTAKTVDKYGLYMEGCLPIMTHFILPNHAGVYVQGELWDVSETTIKYLDRLEGHPDWYCRHMVNVEQTSGEESGKYHSAAAYIFNGTPSLNSAPIESGKYGGWYLPTPDPTDHE